MRIIKIAPLLAIMFTLLTLYESERLYAADGLSTCWGPEIYFTAANLVVCDGPSTYYAADPLRACFGPEIFFAYDTHPPDQPVNQSPVNGLSDVSLQPTLEASVFSDPDVGDRHQASQWQIRSSYSQFYDSGPTGTNLTSITIPVDMLDDGETYFWRVRYQDDTGQWSEDWSDETSFTTLKIPDPEKAERIIFDMDGDIWIMKPDGSEPTRLTSGPSYDSYPRFNSEGSRIAFSSDRGGPYQIWTMKPDGSDLSVVDGFSSGNRICLDWSPNDDQFVAGALGDKFWIVKADGSDASELVYHSRSQALQADWSSLGRIALGIYFYDSSTQVYTIDPDGGNEISFPMVSAWPCWNWDGNSIIVSVIDDLWLTNAVGENAKNLTETAEWTETASCYSTDTTMIYYCAWQSGSPGQGKIVRAMADGSSPTPIYITGNWIGSIDCAEIQLGSNQPPNQPVNLLPEDKITTASLIPILTADSFLDSDPGDIHAASRWQVRLMSTGYDEAVLDEISEIELESFKIYDPNILVLGQEYAWRVRYIDDKGNASAWSEETTFTTMKPVLDASDRILIVAGGADESANAIRSQTQFLTGYAYRLSHNRHVPDSQIRLLSAFASNTDVPPDIWNQVYQPSNLTNFEAALNPVDGFAARADKLIVYMVDHGSHDTTDWYFNLNETEIVSANQVDDLLDTLQSAYPNMKIALIVDCCYSGGFVNTCQPDPGQIRICVSGSTDESLAIFNGSIAAVSFSNFFFDALSAGHHFKQAFGEAREAIIAAYSGPPSHPLQVPWLEDNWDGQISTKSDGDLADDFYWGTTEAFGALPPTILSVTPDQTFDMAISQTLTLEVELLKGFNITKVCAVITPPTAVFTDGQPITEDSKALTLIDLDPSQASDMMGMTNIGLTEVAAMSEVWSKEITIDKENGFGRYGKYLITFYVTGNDGSSDDNLLAIPRMSTIVLTNSENSVASPWQLYE